MKFLGIGVVMTVLTLVIGFGIFSQNAPSNEVDKMMASAGFGNGYTAVVYRSPSCGCCMGYAEELERQGFTVEVVSTDDMAAVKEKYNIPADKQSCHTIAIGDYVVEGHVPMEAVAKLLNEKPDIEGIGLPGMPSGTPGMPGPKQAPYDVYQLSEGISSPYVII